jgi:hypothetical protein
MTPFGLPHCALWGHFDSVSTLRQNVSYARTLCAKPILNGSVMKKKFKLLVISLIILILLLGILYFLPYLKAQFFLRYIQLSKTNNTIFNKTVFPIKYDNNIFKNSFIQIENIQIYNFLNNYKLIKAKITKTGDKYYIYNKDDININFIFWNKPSSLIKSVYYDQKSKSNEIFDKQLLYILNNENIVSDYVLYKELLEISIKDLNPFFNRKKQKVMFNKLLLKWMIFLDCYDIKLIETNYLNAVIKYKNEKNQMEIGIWNKEFNKFVVIAVSKTINEDKIIEFLSLIKI